MEKSKAQAIVDMKKENPKMTAREIAEKLGTKIQYVYTTMCMDRKKNNPNAKSKVGRPKKAKVAKKNVALVPSKAIVPVNNVSLMDHYAKTIREMRTEINELTVVIAYLEHRCARAEAKNGASV